MDDKIKENIDEVLFFYNINFKKYLFSIFLLVIFEKCNKLWGRIVKYFIFIILYEKVEYDEKGIKIIINSKIFNDI